MKASKKQFSLAYFILFILLNFGALGFGIYLMNGGPLSEWYTTLNQAPWTPPNPTFGIAWSIIMVFFSLFMEQLMRHKENNFDLWMLFGVQWILNAGWNLIFFNLHQVFFGLLVLIVLLVVVLYLSILGYSQSKKLVLFNMPYLLWLLVAISLNGYILLMN
ncbi:MAG: TspO/MBR family protein [Flavobacteriales bacterium]